MLKPAFVSQMSEAMADVYGAVTDKILINLAKYFPFLKAGVEMPGSFDYQARMLAQMGQINKETIDIIMSGLDGADQALRQALEASIIHALEAEEPKLRKAAEKGILQPPSVPEVVPGQMQAFQAYYRQSADKLNLVNTVMLESTQAAYTATVSDIANKIVRTQTILNVGAGEVVTGVTAYNQAVRESVKKMVFNGITGFIDHGGHHWSPEAYAAMDIRTTMNNVARAATWERNESYGNDLYQVSWHNGARPLCYPWQGKVISRSDLSREVEDLDGNKVHVYAQSETSYGQPAGLMGINCGHYPMVFIPGISTLYDVPQDEEENKKDYEESQQQRALERKLRYEKRDLEVLKAQGASEDILKAQQAKVKKASHDIDDFCEETGRTRRRDREATPINAKFPPKGSYIPALFPTEQRDKMQEFFRENNQPIQTEIQTRFTPAKSIDEAIKRAESGGVKYARFEGMNLERANNALEALETLPQNARPIAIANGKDISIMTDRPLGRKADQWYGVTYDYRVSYIRTMQLGYASDPNGGILVGLNTQKFKTLEQLTKAKEAEQAKYRAKTGRDWFFNIDGKASAFHEMGHVYADYNGLPNGWNELSERWATESGADMLKKPEEAFAEAWGAYYSKGRKLPSYIEEVIKGLK